MSKKNESEAYALALGQFILSQNPYGQAKEIGKRQRTRRSRVQRKPKDLGRFKSRSVAAARNDGERHVEEFELDGKASGFFNTDGNRLTVEDVLRLKAIPQQGVWWYFQGSPRYISKALRIPYTYTIEDEDGNPVEVSDWLLIGFEGASW